MSLSNSAYVLKNKLRTSSASISAWPELLSFSSQSAAAVPVSRETAELSSAERKHLNESQLEVADSAASRKAGKACAATAGAAITNELGRIRLSD